ncbi:hypothetical protein REPUB_Repub16aG0013600 [Reevesia pubescens]
MKKALALLSLVVILSLTLPLGMHADAGGARDKRTYEQQGFCYDKFDMLMDPYCNPETCNNLCESKKFD